MNLRPVRTTNQPSPFDALVTLPDGTKLVSKNSDHLRCHVPLPPAAAVGAIRQQLLDAGFRDHHDPNATSIAMTRGSDEVLGSARTRPDGSSELILVYRREDD